MQPVVSSVLVINDDGVSAPGLSALLRSLKESGCFLIQVVVPAEEQSGVALHITLDKPVYAAPITLDGDLRDINAHVVWGTPVDCVKLALRGLIPGFRPDLVISGINRGSNIARVMSYSGTVAGALEAQMNGISSVSLSLDRAASGVWDYSYAAEIGVRICREFIDARLAGCSTLNVNIPGVPAAKIKGVRFVPQGRAFYDEYYLQQGQDSGGRTRFRLQGTLNVPDKENFTDCTALADGWVTLTPVGLQFEDTAFMRGLTTEVRNRIEDIKL